MKTFYLTGQTSFGNRGCEALVRSTVKILNEKFDEVKILVPSTDMEKDRKQWPDHKNYGVKFVAAYSPFVAKLWKVIQSLPFPFVTKKLWPLPLPKWYKDNILQADMVLAIGGDNYSLDYFSLPGLLMASDRIAMDAGKLVILWGASLGPYKEGQIADAMLEHLSKMSLITIRETLSYEYLKSKGFKNIKLVADPAFVLDKEEVDRESFWPEKSNGVVGINISPLAVKSRYRKDDEKDIRQEVANFIKKLVGKGYSVILIPHVMPLDNSAGNNDRHYMKNNILNLTGDMNGKVTITPSGMNACQIKYIISKCDYFIGARTHSTIAALSCGVPTISIAYSRKAMGLNQDLFDNTDYVLDTSEMSEESLSEYFSKLESDKNEIRGLLESRIPEWKVKAQAGADYLEFS